MDKNNYLNPTLIKAQCNVAIRKLETDNEACHVAEKSLDNFIQDAEIKSSAFDALKQQIADYKTVLQAVRSANDADIADFKTLSGTVGDEVLDGSVILAGKEFAYKEKLANESKAQEYEEMANTESFFLWEWHYRSVANNYWEMAEKYDRIHLEWWCKESAYDNIVFLTSKLFTASKDTRAAAHSGLQSIAGAYVNGVYQPDINASWRTDIVDCYIERVITVTEEGEVIINMAEVEKILNKDAEDITPQEYDAVALVYLNANEEELGLFLQCMMGERVDVEYSSIERVIGICGGFRSEDYSEWKVDEQKTEMLQERLASTAEETLLMIQMFRMVPDDESARVMIKQRDVILQRLTLLEVIEEIGAFRGEYEGEHPEIFVSNGEEGALVLEVHELRNIAQGSGPAIFNNLGTSTVIIGKTLLGTQIDKNVIEGMEYRFNSHFGGYSVLADGAATALEVYSGLKLESQVEDLSRYLMRNGEKRLGELVGYVPIIGDIVSIPIEVMQDYAQAEADAEFMEEEFKGLKSAEIYSDFDCCANFVQYDTADNSSTVIYAYAGERTDEIIAGLNNDLGSTWTREQLFKNPNEVWDWVRELSGDGFDKYDEVIKQKGEEK